jgi:hypothetical protein
MSETFTLNETPADAPELNADEQESLALADSMEQGENGLLAGKYSSVEELERGYLEAQKMIGGNQEEVTEDQEEVSEEAEEYEPSEIASFLNEASSEYFDRGELSAETMESLTQLSSEDLVAAYIESQQNQQPVSTEMSSSDINAIKNTVGGEAEYGALLSWAGENLDNQSIEAFDSLIESGNTKAIQMAVAGLYSMYESQNGSEGQMITGKAPSTTGEYFRSQAEVVEAMSDPRYDRDPAYRDNIIAKLERSDNFF